MLKTTIYALSLLFVCAMYMPTFANDDISKTESTITLINLNYADSSSLQQLKGLGERKAEAIINYREKHGPFKNINDVLNVKGVGKKFLSDNQEKLSI